jgi:Ca-activated chloride channel homolog
VPRLLLLSDGLANVGPSSPEDLGRLGAALLKEGIAVSTVGVGTDYNEDLMTRLSQQSDGNAYFAAAGADLKRIFNAELGSVLNVVARQVTIEIVCGEGVRPLRVIGREGRIRGNRVEFTLNQIYGGQEKFALIEVEVPATGAGAHRPLATATCRYEDALTRKSDTADATVSVRFSRDQESIDRSVRPAVVVEIARNSAAVVRDEAIGLNDKGQNGAAQVALKAESARLRALGEKYKLHDVVREADALEAAAPAMAEQLDSKSRKDMRTYNFQIYNQQEAR